MSDLDSFMWTELPGKCPFCGQDTVYKNNIVLTTLPPKFQYKCKSCDRTWIAYSDYEALIAYSGYEALHTNKPAAADSPLSSKPMNNYTVGDFPINWGQQGWICPKCGRVNAPHVDHCPCSEPGITTISTSTTPDYNLLPKTTCITVTDSDTTTTVSSNWIQPYISAIENATVEDLTEQEKSELLKNVTVTGDETCNLPKPGISKM